MGQPFQTIQTADPVSNRIQDNVASALNDQSGPFIGGSLLSSVALSSSSSTVINHKLGRQPVVWTIADQNSNSVVWRTAWDKNSITLSCSANCTINLWVN